MSREHFIVPCCYEKCEIDFHCMRVYSYNNSEGSTNSSCLQRLRHKITMMGFEHNDIDPDEYVTMQVIKVHLRKNLPILSPVIQRAVAEGFSANLKGATRCAEGEF